MNENVILLLGLVVVAVMVVALARSHVVEVTFADHHPGGDALVGHRVVADDGTVEVHQHRWYSDELRELAGGDVQVMTRETRAGIRVSFQSPATGEWVPLHAVDGGAA